MTKASGYSLWLVPDAGSELYRALAKCIAEIAAEKRSPKFVPHVTLLGGISGAEEVVCDKTRKLSGMLKSYEIQLSDVGSHGIYLQILFLKIKQTEAVMRANLIAQQVFKVDKGVYFPHLSLAYGDFSEAEVLMLQSAFEEHDCAISGKKFPVREIELWRTEGVVQNWYRVAVYPLKSWRQRNENDR